MRVFDFNLFENLNNNSFSVFRLRKIKLDLQLKKDYIKIKIHVMFWL